MPYIWRKNIDEFVVKLTSSPSSTRFATSQYLEFRKLLDSLPVFIQTFRKHKYTIVEKYKIAGQDFVLDLLGVCDVLEPFLKVFLEVQSISTPVWKIVTWWPRLKAHVQETVEELKRGKTTRLLLLDKNITDILTLQYKNIELVRGWIVVSTETYTKGKNKQIVDNWQQRECSDVLDDLTGLLESLLHSFESRIAKCSKEVMRLTSCLGHSFVSDDWREVRTWQNIIGER